MKWVNWFRQLNESVVAVVTLFIVYTIINCTDFEKCLIVWTEGHSRIQWDTDIPRKLVCDPEYLRDS